MWSMSQRNAKDDSVAFGLSSLRRELPLPKGGKTRKQHVGMRNQEPGCGDVTFEMPSDIKVKPLIRLLDI